MNPGDELTLEELNLLRDALIASYSDFEEIRSLVRFQLGDRLNGIARGIALDTGVDRVIGWAENQGRVGDLIDGLCKDRPNNAKVIALLQKTKESFVLPSHDFEEASVPAHWSAKSSGLEAIVEKANPILRAGAWREQMAIAERRVCRIEAPEGNPIGTGFLVGSDLLLTACHVYRLIAGKTSLARFDYAGPEAKGATRGFKGRRPLAISTEDNLDCALLRLDGAMEEGDGFSRRATPSQ